MPSVTLSAELLRFSEKVASLSDIRNVSANSPISFEIQHPTTGIKFVVFGAVNEPVALGIPINALWVVLNPSNLYYKRPLKLKSTLGPGDSNIAGAISDGGFAQSWIEVADYASLFSSPQTYSVAQGVQGPAGPPGNPGFIIRGTYNSTTTYAQNEVVYYLGSSYSSISDGNTNHTPDAVSSSYWSKVASKGDSPTVDYSALIDEVVTQLNLPSTITLAVLPSEITELSTQQLSVIANYVNGATKAITGEVTYGVNPTNAGSVNSTGLFTANNVSADTPTTVTATYGSGPSAKSSSRNTVVKNRIPQTLTISGPATIAEGGTAQYVATITYNIGPDQVLTGSQATWGLSTGALGAISSTGLLTAATVTADQTGNVTASFTESAVTVTNAKTVTVTNTVAPVYPRYGVGPAVDVSAYNSAYINALSGAATNPGIVNSFTINSASGQYMYYAFPKSYGLAQFEDQAAQGFFGGWDGAKGDPFDPSKYGPVEVSATVGGITQAWYLYRTDYDGLGNTTWNVTAKT